MSANSINYKALNTIYKIFPKKTITSGRGIISRSTSKDTIHVPSAQSFFVHIRFTSLFHIAAYFIFFEILSDPPRLIYMHDDGTRVPALPTSMRAHHIWGIIGRRKQKITGLPLFLFAALSGKRERERHQITKNKKERQTSSGALLFLEWFQIKISPRTWVIKSFGRFSVL